jgi:hypothetical protein
VAQRMRMHIRGKTAKHGQPLDDAADTARRQARFAAGLIEPPQLESISVTQHVQIYLRRA